MKKTFLLLFTLFFLYTGAFSQKQDLSKDYSPLVSAGIIPDDFLIMTYEKFQKDKEDLGRDDSRKDRIAKKEFLLSSNYGIDNLLQSGRVIFGDPVTEYINKVADKLLVNEPALRKKLRFYTLKSTEVNAFSTNQGILFVSIGLVAQVENEAQLAFVLAHEIGHYVEEHVINSYVDAKKILKNRENLYRNSDELEDILSDYSKEKEFEADEYALKLLSKTDYDLDKAAGVFEVLQYSYLPYDEIPFDTSFFNDSYFKLPQGYFLENVLEIKGEDDYDDSKSSHPNIRKRREQYDKIREQSGKGKGNQTCLTSNEEFEYAQWLCRFEMSRLYLIRRSYGMSFYNSYLLIQKFPDNAYANAVLGKSLFFLSKYKTNKSPFKIQDEKSRILGYNRSRSSKEEFIVKYKDIEGEVQQVFYLFSKLSGEEINVLATRHLWDSYLKYGDKHGLEFFAKESVGDMANLFEKPKNKFSLTPPSPSDTLKKEEVIEEVEEQKELSKYDKIKKKKKEKEEEESTEYWVYAFTDTLLKNEVFKKEFDEAYEEAERIVKELEKLQNLSSKEKSKMRREFEQDLKYNNRKGVGLGIDKIVVFDPFYYKLVYKFNETKLELIESEKSREEYNALVATTAKAAGIEVDILAYNNLTEDDVEKYNDLAFLNEWYSEKAIHKSSVQQVSESNSLKLVSDKYNTPYFSISGVIMEKSKDVASHYVLGVALITTVYLAPLGVGIMAKGDNEIYVYNSIYNIETGKTVASKKFNESVTDRKDYLKSILYSFYIKVKGK